jgi:hypothetical protein
MEDYFLFWDKIQDPYRKGQVILAISGKVGLQVSREKIACLCLIIRVQDKMLILYMDH